jgi:hypothetical protein
MTGLEFALVALAGVLLGRFLPNRRKGLEAQKHVAPVCGCGHHHSYHDPKTGECHSLMKVPSSASRDSYHTPCTCRQYSGPVPMPEFYAPEVSA